MKNQRRRLTSFVIALCMMIGLFQSVPAMAVTEGGSVDLAITTADGWSGEGYEVNDGVFSFANMDGTGTYIYDSYEFSEDFTFFAQDMLVWAGSADILLCYQDADNYYKVSVGQENSITKKVAGEETVLATSDDVYLGQHMPIRVLHTLSGDIIVSTGDEGSNGIDTIIFSCSDKDLKSGKVGLSSTIAGGEFSGINLSGSVLSGGVQAEGTKELKDTALIVDGGQSDWSFEGKYEIKFPSPSWGMIEYSTYGDLSGQMINSKYDMTGSFTYRSKQFQIYTVGANTSFIFCYQDANNYYKLTVGPSETKLVKVIDGVETLLAETDERININSNSQSAVCIERSSTGAIVVKTGKAATDGTETTLLRVIDNDLTHGYVGVATAASGGYFAELRVSGTSIYDGSSEPVVTPAPATDPDIPMGESTKSVDDGMLNVASDWSGNNYNMAETSWGKIEFETYGTNSGTYLYDKSVFVDDFTFRSEQINVYQGTANFLFCYQNTNKYYKLTVGEDTKLSKATGDGAEEVIATSTVDTSGEIRIDISHSADGTIVVKKRNKNATDFEEIFNVVDTDLKYGKIGFTSVGSGGYFALVYAKGTAYVYANETPAPTAVPPATAAPSATIKPIEPDTEIGAVYEEDFDSISDTEAALWVNVGQNAAALEIADGKIKGGDWAGTGAMIYTGRKFNDEDYVYSVELSNNSGNSASNSGSALFNYSASAGANGASQSGYAVEIQGGTAGTVALKKYTQDVWNNVETIGTFTCGESLKEKTVKAEISYEKGGKISVDIIVGTNKYDAFDVEDTTFASGYIGVMKNYSNAEFDNVVIGGRIEKNVNTVDASDRQYTRYLGRAKAFGNVVRGYFPYCGLEFTVENAKQVQLEMKRINSSNAYIGVFLDGSEDYTILKISNTTYDYVPIVNLPDADKHTVKVIKLDGVNSGIDINNIRVIETEAGTSKVAPTQARDRKIEFIGDSITVGYGLMNGVDSTENAYLSYAGQTATYFGADVSMPAISGSGFVATENEWGSIRNNAFYPYICAWQGFTEANAWNFDEFKPDVIVINLGTNGGSQNTPDHYYNFVKQIRELNGDADTKAIPIIVGQGPMGQAAIGNIREAVERLNNEGDTNVYALGLLSNGMGGVDNHPTVEQDAEVAAVLEAKITELLGWEKADNFNEGMLADIVTPASVSGNTVTSTITTVYDKVNGYVAEFDGTKVVQVKKVTVNKGEDETVVTANITKTDASNTLKLFIFANSGIVPACDAQIVD